MFGGMDGRRNDQGNPSPNSDVYLLQLGAGTSFEWSAPEIEPSSAIPPARTLHTILAGGGDELVLFAGMHSTTPYQVLNDGWTLDVTNFEWRPMSFKSKMNAKSSGKRRMTGRIIEVLHTKGATDNSRAGSNASISGMERGSLLPMGTFGQLALAATSAVSDFRGKQAGGGALPAVEENTWKRAIHRKKLTLPGIAFGHLGKPKTKLFDKSAILASEEEQFHNDILSMVTRASGGFGDEAGVDPTTLPAPRANHSAALYESTMVVFGGHGGHGYQRRAFNDVWTLNLENCRWGEMTCHGNPPAPRSGHASFQKDGSVYIFGGWNSEMQFNDLFMLDVDNKDWSDLDLGWGAPRWNMAVQLVEAIPSWRVFVFGGSADRLSEGRSMGSFDRKIGVLELGEETMWDEPLPVEAPGSKPPLGREHPAICYEPEESRLIIFGGWANKWLDDLWQINVSSIVGPPYAIGRVEPSLGPVTGNQSIEVHGVGFESTHGSVVVTFMGLGGKFSAETQGTVVHDELVTCSTPAALISQCPKECEVRVAIGNRAFTTTKAEYTYYFNTSAEQSLCYGPGLLEDQQADLLTRFVIQARNQYGENRRSGDDTWNISVQHQALTADGKAILKEIPFEVQDFNNGQYEVRYTAAIGSYLVYVKLKDEIGTLRPLRGSPFKPSMIQYGKKRANDFTGPLLSSWIGNTLKQLEEFYRQTETGRSSKIGEGDIKALIKVMDNIKAMSDKDSEVVRKMDEVMEALHHLEKEGIPGEKNLKVLKRISSNFTQLKVECLQTLTSIQPLRLQMSDAYGKKIASFEQELRTYQGGLRKEAYYFYQSGLELAFERIQSATDHLDAKSQEYNDLLLIANNFEYPDELVISSKFLGQMRDEVAVAQTLWQHEVERIMLTEFFLVQKWGEVVASDMEDDVKASFKKLKEFKADRKSDVFLGMQDIYKRWTVFCPLFAELRDPSMRPRHWRTLMELCGKNVEVNDSILLRDMWNMELHRFPTEVEDIGEQSKQEAKMEATILSLITTWSSKEFTFEPHKGSDVMLMKLTEESTEILEDNQVQVQNMFASRFLATFENEVTAWQKTLSQIAETTSLLSEVLRVWVFLENLFIHSEEVKKELPDESERFLDIDDAVKVLLSAGKEIRLVKTFCADENTFKVLEKTQIQLTVCQKALQEFMDGKRRAFPRFYFMSAADLLDVLSNGNNPARVIPQFPKFFNNIDRFELEYPDGPNTRLVAVGMHACTGQEYVQFPESLPLFGKVEIYLQSCIEAFRGALKFNVKKDLEEYVTSDCESNGLRRGQWLLNVDAAQCALLVQLITWVQLVENGFKLDDVKSARDRQHALLLELIKITSTSLDKPARQKVVCAITLDAHNRDVQDRLVHDKVITADAFQWQSMLKSYWVEEEDDVQMRICDANFWYAYEYLGNGTRLVVTPLTDRIYVTATQALHLCMGCAPAGPAGTGKTESTKDLANALARACYVINATPELDYVTLGNIFKGLAASGSWGCFDEFNRLLPEVLSVCTVQFKAVCDASRRHSMRFILQGDEIQLDDGVGVFITMNPGYLGRSELPEGLKALFRPITVMVPDFKLIMENMFMSEGFLEASDLALKFATLYALNKDLLSKSNKYDWGMRAIKSVLVVAGGFKRADPSLSEQSVLMRSLRDTNLAKIDGDDLKIFRGLLQDLFPGIVVARSRDLEFEKLIVGVLENDFNYTHDPDGYLLLKITQFVELLAIRHSVFLMGNPGTFKSAMWRVLKSAKTKCGDKTTVVDFNPKAISTSELYGSVNMASRDWKDGIVSKTMRELGQIPDTHPKWILLDGDLDANWIESMNSVMDDTRLLTLPSNERIPLRQHMKMIFEIRDLNHATPATATRAGIVCMSDVDGVQWRSYVNSWIRNKIASISSSTSAWEDGLNKLFDKYCPEVLNWISKNAKIWVPSYDIAFISVLCSLLDALMAQTADNLEPTFVMCSVFAFGSCLSEVDGVDYRKGFSNWWKAEMKGSVKFPSKGTVFDYYVRDGRIEEWSSQVETIAYTSETPMGEVTVPTTETVSTSHFMKSLIDVNHPVMLVGLAGCGKTQLCSGLLKRLDPAVFATHKINMNYYTDSKLLQTMMESPLEKKAGKLYAPPGKLQLIYLVDDLNMPALDKYNTQSAIELLKQKQDYSHWYDRQKITVKDIGNTQYVCCMNPTAGSFVVNQRLQRHFWTSAIQFPEQSSLSTIYQTFMKGHFEHLKFKHQVQDQALGVIKAALSLHTTVCSTFRKTAKNMHYEFNIRHMSGVFSGLLQAKPSEFHDAEKLALLWIHESERIYCDRLVSVSDHRKYRGLVGELSKKMFAKFNFSKYFQENHPESLVFAPFSKGLADMADGPTYDKIKDMDRLSYILGGAMREYDATYAAMNLVLFEDAMKHVARICRIISNPSGHLLLVGVGGSGRQSLTRLSSFICQNMTITLVISSTYGINDLKTDLQWMFKRTGEKDEGVVFLLTDGQIPDERFLVLLNDLLASGEITDLYTGEDKDLIRNAVRSDCKAAGNIDTPDNLWSFYLSRVARNLHMSICFSPVGDMMWSRARKFPALVNCTIIDWFQPWPVEALHNVSQKYFAPVAQLGPKDSQQRNAIVGFFPFSFGTVSRLCDVFIQKERRFAYTTPKTFLELIKLTKQMLERKADALDDKKVRLTRGLVKLRETQETVAVLEEELKVKAIVVQERAQHADQFAEEVGRERAKVNAEAERANIEAVKCAQIQVQVGEKKEICKRDLAEALPLVMQAEAALDVLDKKDFNELKAFSKPPPGVDIVCEACMHLQAGIDPNIELDKRGRVKDRTWRGMLKMLNDPTKFLQNLKDFKGEIDALRVPSQNAEEARRLKDSMGEGFTKENMSRKAQAAGGLCEWIINILLYYDVVAQVEPKKRELNSATQMLVAANARRKQVQEQVAELEARLAQLVAAFDRAVEDKMAVVAEAEKCQIKLGYAQRLVGALSANGVIWQQTVEKTEAELVYILGDTLVACSFASYVGVFTREYRETAVKQFVAFLAEKQVPLGPLADPLVVLATEAEQAKWCSAGLPRDRISLENGAIMNCSERWCLMIDPQTQGIVWVKNKEADNRLQVGRMGNEKLVKVFEAAIDAGQSVLIENMGETVDAVLQPVITRNTIRRGTKRTLKLGDKEINYNASFKLFLHTKLSNPHYPPEIQAECTVINFTVTESGLEDQMLFLVMRLERPDLARRKSELVQQQNEQKVKLADLEALLLEKLANSEGDILDDVDLIISLEEAKLTSDDAKEQLRLAVETEFKINKTSEYYRPAANRGALLFFLMMDLSKMHTFYRYSLDAFVGVATRAVDGITLVQKVVESKKALLQSFVQEASGEADVLAAMALHEGDDKGDGEGARGEDEGEEFEKELEEHEVIVELVGKDLTERVELLVTTVTSCVFSYIRRGLLDSDKLTVAAMLSLRILVRTGAVTSHELSLLINAPPERSTSPMPDNTKSWLTETQWAQLKSLEHIAVFKAASGGLIQNLEQDSLGWRRWFAEDRAELADLPRSCRDLKLFHRLFLLRVLRPDRLGSALTQFVTDTLGAEFVEQAPFDMEQLYNESTCYTPFFFVLFPGTDPTPLVEAFAKKKGCSEGNGRLVNISMGQGQEKVAINALHKAANDGGWVMLQNIHLMQSWMKVLERTLELIDDYAHPHFRCVLSSEPPSPLQGPFWDLVPEAVLQKCVKITDEAPTDVKSNLRRSYAKFSQETIDACTRPKEFKATLFALCFFHSLITGRIKFGAQGWSKKYPFNDGDLTICGQVLANYVNNADRLGTDIPWPDLRYIFGDIMYGGHITDFWDRRVCQTYLQLLLLPELLNNLTLAPGFKSPDASKMEYHHYQKFIEERFPPEQPMLFGLHPNAEIGFLTTQGIAIFKTVQSVSGAGGSSSSLDISACSPIITKYLDELPGDLDMVDVRSKLRDEDYTPYVITSLQESDSLNRLLAEVRGSLSELELGIGGHLNVTESMERLSDSLQLNRVSASWQSHAYPSLKSLSSWFVDLVKRADQLAKWTGERKLLKSIWLPGLFNPMAFLTAVMQVTARDRNWPLDFMANRTTATNSRDPLDFVAPPAKGVYVHGLFLEGASWEDGKGDEEGYITDSKMKELHPEMPIINVFSLHIDQVNWLGMYHGPVFITSSRGATFVVEVNLRMDPDDAEMRWILAGAALLLTDD